MGVHECTKAFLDHVPGPGGEVQSVPIQVAQACFLNTELFFDLTTLNRTACINDVTEFHKGITYACTYYYLSMQGNESSCRQFYHIHADYFDVVPCYTLGENLANLFEITTSPVEVTIFVVTLIYTIFWLLHDCQASIS